MLQSYNLKSALLGAMLLPMASMAAAEKIEIAIGHQSMCTDTYTAGIVVKELGLLEKYLPTDGKYADAKYKVSWADYSSGGPITNQMMANKLNFGVMGDYPLIVNGAKFQETDSLRTLYVAGTGYNLKGSGNAIVVPVDSDMYSITDLKGKEVSTPVGSAAWGMLLKAMQDNGIPTGEYVLKTRAPRSARPISRPGRSTHIPTFAPGLKSWNSAVPVGKSMMGLKPACPICMASWSVRTLPKNTQK